MSAKITCRVVACEPEVKGGDLVLDKTIEVTADNADEWLDFVSPIWNRGPKGLTAAYMPDEAKPTTSIYFDGELWSGYGFPYVTPCPSCNDLSIFGYPDSAIGKFYCSKECRTKHHGRKQAERRKAERASNRTPRPCGNCGDQFQPKRSDAKFCSTKCRVSAKRTRDSVCNG